MPEGAFAVAWGEGILADRADGYDLGYGALPQKDGFFTEPFLKLTKVAEPEEVAPGGEFTITLTLASASAPIEDVLIADILPNEDSSTWRAPPTLPARPGRGQIDPADPDGPEAPWTCRTPLGRDYDPAPALPARRDVHSQVDGAAEYGAPCPTPG